MHDARGHVEGNTRRFADMLTSHGRHGRQRSLMRGIRRRESGVESARESGCEVRSSSSGSRKGRCAPPDGECFSRGSRRRRRRRGCTWRAGGSRRACVCRHKSQLLAASERQARTGTSLARGAEPCQSACL
jgi:hypothetical protein